MQSKKQNSNAEFYALQTAQFPMYISLNYQVITT